MHFARAISNSVSWLRGKERDCQNLEGRCAARARRCNSSKRKKRIYPFNLALGEVAVSSSHEQILALFSSPQQSPVRNGARGDGCVCVAIRMDFIVAMDFKNALPRECSGMKSETINLHPRHWFRGFLLANARMWGGRGGGRDASDYRHIRSP